MPPRLEESFRARIAALPLAFVEKMLGRFTGDQQRQYRPVIEAASIAADEARATLHHWVEAGRRAGMSWNEIGTLLGVSKQAAQKRFGAGEAEAAPFGTIAIALGTTARTEDEHLAIEGEAGRELIGADAAHLRFRQTQQRWEHLRSVGPVAEDEGQAGGWIPAARWFVFEYYKRPA